ncbi:hypothetical protein A5687_21305 [Mycobacterium mantenii]|nr:hypothetical protein A5687_21305 [Mycobacterium mantenii]
MKEGRTVGTDVLQARGNFAIISPTLDEDDISYLSAKVPEWSYIGTLEAAAKEYKTAAPILVYRP